MGSPLRFASHSATHPNLLTLDDLSARKEIADSKRDLEDHLDRPVEAFSYPVGLFGSRERTFADEAGYEFAVSCEPGLNETRTDALALRRTLIESRDRALDFAAKVGGGHDAPLPLRRLSRRVRYGAS